MVVHSLKGNEFPKPSEIHISEQENECVIIVRDYDGNSADISFNVNQLYNLIGTLLHVQQKLKSN